jgi:SET domain-containing protein
MPQLFKMEVKYSPVSGLGLFTCEDIPKGAVWWTFKTNDKCVPCENAPNLPNIVLKEEDSREFVKNKTQEELAHILEHTMYYSHAEAILILRDGAGVVNHSFEPNSQVIYNAEKNAEQLHSVALRDIKAGEEIVENYGNYPKISSNWSEAFFQKYVPSRLEFEASYDIKKVAA